MASAGELQNSLWSLVVQDWARSPAAGAGLGVIGPFRSPAEQACDGKSKLILFLKVSKNWKTGKNLLLLSFDGFAALVQPLVVARTLCLVFQMLKQGSMQRKKQPDFAAVTEAPFQAVSWEAGSCPQLLVLALV